MKLCEFEKSYIEKSICISLETGKIVNEEFPKVLVNPSEENFDIDNSLKQFDELRSVGIWFAKSTDGRGYSFASRIRERHQKILIHALGNINEELSYYLKRTGFNYIYLHNQNSDEYKKKSSTSISKEIINPFKSHYQSGRDQSDGLYS